MAKLKKGRVKVIICETCHGNGCRVAKLWYPSVDLETEEVHQCWDWTRGEFYETTDLLIDDGSSDSVH